jgi:CRP-like cAMP-binding protein
MVMPETLTLIEKTVFLKSIKSMSEIPTEALAQIAGRATEMFAEPGQVLFREGEPDRGTFIVIEGRIELRKGDAVVLELNPGAAHGEFFIEENQAHRYTGIARAECHLLNIPRDDLVEVLLDYPEFGLAMVRVHAQRVNQLTQRVIELEAENKKLNEALGRNSDPPPPPQADGKE